MKIEFVCEVCGKTRKAHSSNRVGRYCSRECYFTAVKRVEAPKKEVKPRAPVGECVFQPESVVCGDRKCENCGWNPVVAKARLDKFLEEHHEFTL